MQPAVRIQVCGPIIVEIDGVRVDGSLPRGRGSALFAYLVINRHRSVERPRLIDALWDSEVPDDAAASLSVLLSRIRRAIGSDKLVGRSSLRLVIEDAVVDIEIAEAAIHRAESAVTRQQWPRAWAAAQTALFTARRTFLVGETGRWIDDVRRDIDSLHVRALETYGLAALGMGGTEVAAAREAGRSLILEAPLHESGHRLLMRALSAEGNQAEALSVYERLRLVLRDELGVAPSPESQQLYESLLG